MGFRIAGTGASLPKRIVTNNDLSAFMETDDEWITSHTGIRERRLLCADESLLDLGVAAARQALEEAGSAPGDIDLLIVSTLGGDYKTPSLSCLIAGELGADSGCITLDINMACCGFIYALNTAAAYMKAGMAKKVLIVSAEAMSRVVDWTDRATCVLFGDASGAVVLDAAALADPVFELAVNGKNGEEHLNASRKASNCPFHPVEDTGYLKMDGPEIYRFAVSAITARIGSLLQKCGKTMEDINHVLLHQANLRIIKGAISRLGFPEKFPHNIERYGNTSSACIPILLHEQRNRFSRGDQLILCAFGAGLSSAACLLEW